MHARARPFCSPELNRAGGRLSRQGRETRMLAKIRAIGRKGGIRTHGGVTPTTLFESAPINRSGTFPYSTDPQPASRRRTASAPRPLRLPGPRGLPLPGG